jgi:hypothetical protein
MTPRSQRKFREWVARWGATSLVSWVEHRPPGLEALMIWRRFTRRWKRRSSTAAPTFVGAPCSRRRQLLAVSVVVDVAGTLQCDLVARDRATLYCLQNCLRVLGLRGRRLRDWVNIAGVCAADWSDHMERIGRRKGILRESVRAQQSLVRVTRPLRTSPGRLIIPSFGIASYDP